MFTLICIATLFYASDRILDGALLARWYAAFILFFITCAIWGVLRLMNCATSNKIVPWMAGALVFCSVILAFQGIIVFIAAPSGTEIKGSFDNTAGYAAALSIIFPVTFYFGSNRHRWIKISAYLSMLIIAAAIVLSGSRTGMFTIFCMLAICLLQKGISGLIRKWLLTASIVLSVVLLAGLYVWKKDSADGRMLIWNCSWKMIRDRPFLGYGYNGFRKHYMEYQAAYFEAFPNAPNALLADNVIRPFNEYISLVISFGLAGLALVVILMLLIYSAYKKHRTPEHSTALLCLVSIAIFSLFSYPFAYPFTWLMSAACTALITDVRIPRKRGIAILMIVLSVVSCSYVIMQMQMRIVWTRISRLPEYVHVTEDFAGYKALYPALANNYLFLYNWAARLNRAGLYEQSNLLSGKAAIQCADYRLQLLRADNHYNLHQFEDAEKYYRSASNMCPNRFIPLYGLFKSYEASGNKAAATFMATMILQRKVKVPSPTVDQIREEARSWLAN